MRKLLWLCEIEFIVELKWMILELVWILKKVLLFELIMKSLDTLKNSFVCVVPIPIFFCFELIISLLEVIESIVEISWFIILVILDVLLVIFLSILIFSEILASFCICSCLEIIEVPIPTLLKI